MRRPVREWAVTVMFAVVTAGALWSAAARSAASAVDAIVWALVGAMCTLTVCAAFVAVWRGRD